MAANVPQVSLSGEAEINTPFKTFYNAGDTLEYEDLVVKFLVNESLENWEEIYNWIAGIGFPKSREQYAQCQLNLNKTLKIYSLKQRLLF